MDTQLSLAVKPTTGGDIEAAFSNKKEFNKYFAQLVESQKTGTLPHGRSK